MSRVIERAARELAVPSVELNNSKVKVKIGATEKRDAPTTVYIQVSFWTKPAPKHVNMSNQELHRLIDKNINRAFKSSASKELEQHYYFTKPKDNITIWNIPDNLNYNSKRNYISLELYLHTLNTDSKNESYPLHSKKDRRLYESALDIANVFADSAFFQGEGDFQIFKTASQV